MRARFLALSDAELLGDCDVDRFRASGPGGQKRNKTESAIRLRHPPTGLSAQATESRSQHENRARALRRLREKIALDLREAVDPARFQVPEELADLIAAGRAGKKTRRSVGYLKAAAALLDLFVAEKCSVAATARRLGTSTGSLSRLLLADERLARRANALRAGRDLRPLR